MRINRRKSNWKFIGAALALSTAITVPAYAGTWIQNQAKPSVRGTVSNWWYQKDDGSYLKNQWVWLDGNQDGISECYRFDENGWMYAETKVDGYDVNEYCKRRYREGCCHDDCGSQHLISLFHILFSRILTRAVSCTFFF